jgi:hypothetical protein
MNKEFVSIGVNTDPLSVQLYFDENNSIKWKIIFKNSENNYLNSNVFEQNNQNNQINQSNSSVIDNTHNDNQTHLINKHFANIFIINCKNTYDFIYNKINLNFENDENNLIEIDYTNFDYIKYNKLIKENLAKNVSWKHYLKNIKNNQKIDLKLNSFEISEINALIDILNKSINSNYIKILIIFDDFILNIKNIKWFNKNINTYEISASDIILLDFIDNNYSDNKISNVGQINKIKSFIITNSLYISFLNKLLQKHCCWETCLLQIIEENYFKSIQINTPIFN